jgi:tetratricopeptide (TPR) repeat protein
MSLPVVMFVKCIAWLRPQQWGLVKASANRGRGALLALALVASLLSLGVMQPGYAQLNQSVILDAQRVQAAVRAYNQGVDAAQGNQYEKAIESYKQAIALNPTLIPAYNNLGTLFEQLEQYEGAIKVYKQAVDVMPQDPLLHRNMGVVYQKMQNIPAALVAYRDYLRLEPKPDPDIKNMVQHYDQQRMAAAGESDYLKLATGGSQGRRLIWPSDLMPIAVQVDLEPDQTPFLKPIQDALRAWEFATDGRIRFQEVSKLKQNIGIQVRLKDGPLTSPSQEVGHAKYSLVTPSVLDGFVSPMGSSKLHVDITLNTGERDAPIPLAYRVAHVKRLAMHELGHALGLWGHSPDPDDIMFARPMSATLSPRDIRTIRRLYRIDNLPASTASGDPASSTNRAINTPWTAAPKLPPVQEATNTNASAPSMSSVVKPRRGWFSKKAP